MSLNEYHKKLSIAKHFRKWGKNRFHKAFVEKFYAENPIDLVKLGF